ncbi:Crp/Fnr family transcriptional regulator [Shimwellia pseudoproteus]|uniref:winged helix-turn-helix transcriptional regulator n=1 Tax=Shimwellia pseudoproteus TaxID=570012 RepID=UPI0018ED54FA|nr:winged helix-turn-helix transcriptional regulator [Shimwellia pseudoproteus]MBJ3815308.1 Crp/Fnr family transcriptional regulator [Shimwellia pseudoproteus]
MHSTPPERPADIMEQLISALSPDAEPVNVVPRKNILWDYKNKTQLYLFKQGALSLLRSSDRLVTVTVHEPHVFGVAEIFQPLRAHILRAEAPSELWRIDAERAADIFTAKNLWMSATQVLAYHTAYMSYRDTLVLQQRTYAVIRNHLLDMMLLPEDTRRKMTILDYIQARTHLSRSSILNVLSALKKGEYIDFVRGGYLVEIKLLPENF